MPSYKDNLPQNPTLSIDTVPTNGSTNLVTSDGVFDALALKQDVLTNPVTGTGTSGQVSYWTGTGTQGGSVNLFWDAANNRLGVGTNAPGFTLHVIGNANIKNASSELIINNSTYTEINYGVNNYFRANGTAAIITGPLIQFRLTSEIARFSSIGNLLLNSTTDNGQRLQVYGSTLLRGSGTTSSTTALLVQNGGATNLFSITDNGQVNYTPVSLTGSEANSAIDIQQTWNTTGAPTLIKANVTNTASNANSLLMDLRVGNATRFKVLNNGQLEIATSALLRPFGSDITPNASGGNLAIFPQNVSATPTGLSSLFFSTNTVALTSGNYDFTGVRLQFVTNSGNASANSLIINSTINQTGGANGITRGLYVNPTLTAAADWRSIEWSNNTGWGLYGAGTANNYLAGSLGIGETTLTGFNLRVNKNISGSVTSIGISSTGNIQSGVTIARYNQSIISNSATSTTTTAIAYFAGQGTISGTITNAYGFFVESSLIGATNDYGFYGDIAAATGRWNLYMNGTAANYLAGDTAIGTSTLQSAVLTIGGSGTQERGISLNKTFTGGTSRFGILQYNTVNSDVTSTAINNYSQFATQAAAFTLTNARHYIVGDIALGAGSSVTNQVGFYCGSISLATNNYAFQGVISAGTGRWNLYMDGTANNYLAGSLGIGSTTLTGNSLIVGKNMTGATGVYGIGSYGIIQSDATSVGVYYDTFVRTANANFNITNIIHYNTSQSTFANITAGGSVTNQIGFSVGSSLIGATNNYGFYGNIPSGTGRWNLYMAGTAANHIAGDTAIGTTTTSGGRLTVRGSGTTSSTTALLVQNSTPATLLQVLDNGRINQALIENTSNTAFGTNALSIASGGNNTAFGRNALQNVTTSINCSAFGRDAAIINTAGDTTAIGALALSLNISGFGNTAIGASALANTTNSGNVGVGRTSGSNNTTGANNTFIGYQAGRYITGGATSLTIANNSIFIGYDTRANADNETNQIVIGYLTTGNGSNTTTIGNASTTNNYIYGNFNIIDKNIILGTTTGTKIGTASNQKLAFFGATPVEKPNTTVGSASLASNGGTTITDTDTFEGYTLQQVVRALIDLGLLT